MGQASSAIKCITDKGIVTGRDFERLRRKYNSDMAGHVTKERGIEFCDDLRPYLVESQCEGDYRSAIKYIRQTSGTHVVFGSVFRLLTQEIGTDLSESAADAMLDLDRNTEPTEARLEREHGIVKDYSTCCQDFNGSNGTESKPVLQFEVHETIQAEAIATHVPRDVLILIFLMDLSLVDINACASVCRRFYLAAREILVETKPPQLHLATSYQMNLSSSSASELYFLDTSGKGTVIGHNGTVRWEDGKTVNIPISVSVPYSHHEKLSVLDFGGDCVLIGYPDWSTINSAGKGCETQFNLLRPSLQTVDLVGTVTLGCQHSYMHELPSGERFAFNFESSVGVLELHLMKSVPKSAKESLVIPGTGLHLVVLDKAMMERPYSSDNLVAKNGIRGTLVDLHDSRNKRGWFSEISEYHPESRTWSSKECSGYLPTVSKSAFVPTGDSHCMLLLNHMWSTGSYLGGVHALNPGVAFWSHVSLGSLRGIPALPNKHVAIVEPGVLLFPSSGPKETQLMAVNRLFPETMEIKSNVVCSRATQLKTFILNLLNRQFLNNLLRNI